MLTDAFDYPLPESAIAQEAIEPRHAARLLIVDGLEDRTFLDLPDLLEPGDLLVVNRTRVRAARLLGKRRPGGGRTEILLTQRLAPDRWRALVRPANKLRAGSVVDCHGLEVRILEDPSEGVTNVTIDAPGDVEEAIEAAGTLPLPPYFKGTLDDPGRYQTIFADEPGSAAAPTAALHFTDTVVGALARKGVPITAVDLEVGLDTFRPITAATIEGHTMHTEHVRVPRDAVDAVRRTRAAGRRVVAVGTTVVRSLESAATTDGLIEEFDGPSDLYVRPGYAPKVVDAMVTNFHAPRTTLLVMLGALIGDRWRDAYRHALDRGYRFLSFGDAMYAEVER